MVCDKVVIGLVLRLSTLHRDAHLRVLVSLNMSYHYFECSADSRKPQILLTTTLLRSSTPISILRRSGYTSKSSGSRTHPSHLSLYIHRRPGSANLSYPYRFRILNCQLDSPSDVTTSDNVLSSLLVKAYCCTCLLFIGFREIQCIRIQDPAH